MANGFRLQLPALNDNDPLDQISARDAVNDIHPARDLAEDCVTAVQMRLRRMGNEKLAAAGVLARQSHPDRAASVRPGVDLAADLIAGAAFAVTARIAALDDEVGNDAVESQVVEKTLARERDKAVHRDRRVLWEEFKLDLAFVGVNRGRDFFVQPRGDALVEEFVVAGLNNWALTTAGIVNTKSTKTRNTKGS